MPALPSHRVLERCDPGEGERLLAAIERDGVAIVSGAVAADVIAAVAHSLPRASGAGVRNLLRVCREAGVIPDSPGVRGITGAVLGQGAFVTRSILFDKSAGANWAVPFHQDATIAVAERRDVPGFSPWSVKAGVPHVQPPAAVLERMLTVRVHIDPCLSGNGPLLVLPGSHAAGFLADAAVSKWIGSTPPLVCDAAPGDAVVFRPLLLHASERAAEPRRRRVVHLEYAIDPLPGGLSWASV